MSDLESPQAETFDAATVINGVIEAKAENGARVSIEEIAEGVRSASVLCVASEQTEIHQYVVGLQDFHHGTIITTLDEEVGGLYNGSERMVASDSLMVDQSIERSLSRSQEADDHEMVHAKGKHTEAYTIYDDGQGSTQYLVLGGITFTDESFREGYTVNATGDRFVSDQYRHFRSLYVSAFQNADVSEAEVDTAINVTHNLAEIDDRTREEEDAASLAITL
ncbi:MAG TPA: hypothetical protein VJB82_04810 [Candidatus Peribacterales bacterium]|nr:hypothetical protein [Candidatus Peribacterales bacterium]